MGLKVSRRMKGLDIACTGPEPRSLVTNRSYHEECMVLLYDLKTHVIAKNEAEAGTADIGSGSVPRWPNDNSQI